MSLKGLNAIVCGASSGIGKAVVIDFLKNRIDKITLVARSEDKLKELCLLAPEKMDYICIDLIKRDLLLPLLKEKLDQHKVYHIFVNNSSGPKANNILDTSDDELLVHFNLHILTSQLLVRTLLPKMQEANYGRIINIISTSVKQPIPNLGASNSIRAAVANWSKSLSKEVGEFVTVNNVLPGYTNTERLKELAETNAKKFAKTVEMIYEEWKAQSPSKRIADPSEIAYGISFLASEKASFINGINLPIDGGRLMSL
jgi:3-oxoacyl-[acyl-carrier protein] reductase